MSKTVKTQEELAVLGQELRTKLQAGLSEQWGMLEQPYPVAHMLLEHKHDKLTLRELEFESVVDAYYGLVIAQWIPQYLQLHERLTKLGHTNAEEQFEIGGDAFVYACADRVLDEYHRVKALVLETQSLNFILVLHERFGQWDLHVRRFWEDLPEVKRTQDGFSMDEYADRTDLTLEDVIKLANQATAKYSDMLPGVTYPSRPHLASFLDGSLTPGKESAGLGLRYADFRDPGYVVSFRSNDRTGPAVEKAVHAPYATVEYVATNLASAIDQLAMAEEEGADEE